MRSDTTGRYLYLPLSYPALLSMHVSPGATATASAAPLKSYLKDTLPARNCIYIDSSSGLTMLDKFCCVMSMLHTESPSWVSETIARRRFDENVPGEIFYLSGRVHHSFVPVVVILWLNGSFTPLPLD